MDPNNFKRQENIFVFIHCRLVRVSLTSIQDVDANHSYTSWSDSDQRYWCSGELE